MMHIIPGLVDVKVLQVAAGAEHSAFITGKKPLTVLHLKI